MDNPVKEYSWGSLSALAALQNREASGRPEAELWMGGHPSGPSLLLEDATAVWDEFAAGGAPAGPGPDEAGRSLPEVVAADPDGVLGADVHARFGPRLPFMLKLLAIGQPLSVQVHPDAARARVVFDRAVFDRAVFDCDMLDGDFPGSGTFDGGLSDGGLFDGGLSDGGLSDGGTFDGEASDREAAGPYVDPYPKPELLHAIEPVEALFGCRPAAEARHLVERLGSPRLQPLLDVLATGTGVPDRDAAALHAALALLTGWPTADRAALVAEIAAGARVAGPQAEYGWVRQLVELHPTDPMVIAPLVLALVRLAPGESLFVPAGVPHCYLTGVAVEVLAASDNVVRAGLTPKPVDVAELLEIVDCRPHARRRPAAAPRSGEPAPELPGSPEAEQFGPHEVAWRPDVEDFQLSRIRVPFGVALAPDQRISGVQIMFCTHGKVQISQTTGGFSGIEDPPAVTLTAGRSAFVAASAGPLVLTGEGELFRAAVGVSPSATQPPTGSRSRS